MKVKMANPEGQEDEWVRPKGRNAPIWNHFKENRKDREQKKESIRVKCNYCPSVFAHSSSTTNYWRHMRNDHSSIKLDEKSTGSKAPTTEDKSRQPLIVSAFSKARNEPLGKAST